jgi:hypothetical protein
LIKRKAIFFWRFWRLGVRTIGQQVNQSLQAWYNGPVERTQREFKDFVKRWQWKATAVELYFLLPETAAHELNLTLRRCLKNPAACGIYLSIKSLVLWARILYFGGDRIRYSIRRRKSIFRWIRDLATEIAIRAGKAKITNVEWRIAAKHWLLRKDLGW